jgi:putative molybdopterin biosynthesis protein
LIIHQAVLPNTPFDKIGFAVGSMDPGLKHLGTVLAQAKAPIALSPVPLSSLDGLIAMRQGLCQASTCHLIDIQTGEYNRSFVQRIFPSQEMALIRIYHREEGFLVKAGNPLGIHTVEDLARPDIRIVNRELGSGVRQWLDLRLAHLKIPSEVVRGYSLVVHSHASVARAIQAGKADVGVGIAASAQTFNLDFIPLFEEPYEIAAPINLLFDPQYSAFFETLNTTEFRTAVSAIAGYTIPQNAGNVEIVR